jgi:hypothetical protein
LRDRHLVDLEPANIQTVTITPAGLPDISLQRLETGWQVVSRPPDRGLTTFQGDTQLIDGLIREIVELKAVPERGFVTDAPSDPQLEEFGLKGRPNWLIRIAGDADDQTSRTLVLGGREASGNLVYAKTGEAPFVFLVDRGLADDLSAKPYYYRDRHLQELPEGAQITALSIERIADENTVFSASLSDPGQTWEQALTEMPLEKRTAASALVAQIRNLEATNIVASTFTSSVPGLLEERPWKWLIEATISLRGGIGQQDTVFRLYVDDYAGGPELLAGAPDLDLVFETGPEFIDAITPLIFERKDPGPPPPASTTQPAAENISTDGEMPSND